MTLRTQRFNTAVLPLVYHARHLSTLCIEPCHIQTLRGGRDGKPPGVVAAGESYCGISAVSPYLDFCRLSDVFRVKSTASKQGGALFKRPRLNGTVPSVLGPGVILNGSVVSPVTPRPTGTLGACHDDRGCIYAAVHIGVIYRITTRSKTHQKGSFSKRSAASICPVKMHCIRRPVLWVWRPIDQPFPATHLAPCVRP